MLKKTLLTLVLTTMVSMLFAQSLQFEYEEQVYENNAIVICDGEPQFGELIQHVQIRNLTTSPIDVVLEKEELKVLPGTINQMCWGMCYSQTVFVLSPVTLEAESVTSPYAVSFHHLIDTLYSDDPANYVVGTSVVKYYAYPENNPDDKIGLEVWFAYNANNVSEMTCNIGNAYPNPASNMVSFRVSHSGNMQASIYNLLGQEVKSLSFNGIQNDQISINVEDLQPGIYFCRFSVNGAEAKTEKFIVKR